MQKKYSDVLDYIEDVVLAIAFKHDKTVERAYNIADPLRWYVLTGRASGSWVKAMYNVKPYVMARVLVNTQGSYDDIVAVIKKKVAKKVINMFDKPPIKWYHVREDKGRGLH